jgi:hypothetical protein
MSSLRKIQSARLNGAKSHGPKTPEGKAISSLNGLRHGLAAKTVVLCNETRDRYNAVHDEYIEEFRPRTPAEKDAVEDMVTAKWRQRRFLGVETATFDLQMDRQAEEIASQFAKTDEMTRLAIAFQTLADKSNTIQMLMRYSAGFRHEYDRAFQRLLELRILNGVGPDPASPESHVNLQSEPNPTSEHNV